MIKSPVRTELAGILGKGEAEAIALASELEAEAILLDETEARKEAHRRGLPVAGTIGILEKAAKANLVDLALSLKRLRETNFRIDEELLREALHRDQRRRTN